MEKDSIPKKNYDIAEIFNEYCIFFTIILSKLNILRYQDPVVDTDQTENWIEHPVLQIIEKYKHYPSIIVINNQNMDRQFSFQEISNWEINLEILNLYSSKACQESDRPTETSKANSDIFTEVSHKELNKGFEVANFSCAVKLVNVTPVYKESNQSDKGNYRLGRYCQTYQKSLNDLLTSKCVNILKG